LSVFTATALGQISVNLLHELIEENKKLAYMKLSGSAVEDKMAKMAQKAKDQKGSK